MLGGYSFLGESTHRISKIADTKPVFVFYDPPERMAYFAIFYATVFFVSYLSFLVKATEQKTAFLHMSHQYPFFGSTDRT